MKGARPVAGALAARHKIELLVYALPILLVLVLGFVAQEKFEDEDENDDEDDPKSPFPVSQSVASPAKLPDDL